MQVRPPTYNIETGHSDPWVARLVVASKAGGINILGRGLQGLPWVQPSFDDPRNKRSLQDQQPPNKHRTQARRVETTLVRSKQRRAHVNDHGDLAGDYDWIAVDCDRKGGPEPVFVKPGWPDTRDLGTLVFEAAWWTLEMS